MQMPRFPEEPELQAVGVLTQRRDRGVYKGRLGSHAVAIKVGESADIEAGLLKRAAGPGLAPCLKSTRTETGAAAFVAPLLRRSVDDIPSTETDGKTARVLEMTRSAAQALARLHRLGWVHGDVAAANVMEAPSRGFSLIDLGAARRIGERPPAPALA